MAEINETNTEVGKTLQETVEIVDQVSEYGSLITNSLYLIVLGMIGIFIVHKLVSKFLYPVVTNMPLIARLLKVVFGTLYVLILAVVLLIVIRELGFDVKIIAKITLLSILAGAVLVFFLVPFIPKLPFIFGDMVEINGVLGVVEAISSFHTTLRKFDGTLVYLPNAVVMASKILNFHQVAERRIEMNITVSTKSNIQESINTFIAIMKADKRVVEAPAAPSVFAVDADSSGIKMSGYCWVNNADFLATRSDLWIKLVDTFLHTENINMARPQNEVYLMEQK